eukprot:6177048-Pleurochrysis_carterae.AAC.10
MGRVADGLLIEAAFLPVRLELRQANKREIHMLTETARAYASKHGFRVRHLLRGGRDAAPVAAERVPAVDRAQPECLAEVAYERLRHGGKNAENRAGASGARSVLMGVRARVRAGAKAGSSACAWSVRRWYFNPARRRRRGARTREPSQPECTFQVLLHAQHQALGYELKRVNCHNTSAHARLEGCSLRFVFKFFVCLKRAQSLCEGSVVALREAPHSHRLRGPAPDVELSGVVPRVVHEVAVAGGDHVFPQALAFALRGIVEHALLRHRKRLSVCVSVCMSVVRLLALSIGLSLPPSSVALALSASLTSPSPWRFRAGYVHF